MNSMCCYVVILYSLKLKQTSNIVIPVLRFKKLAVYINIVKAS